MKLLSAYLTIMAAALMLTLSACSLQTPAKIVGGTILASDSVDRAQAEFGHLSNSPHLMAELDALQGEILSTIATGGSIEKTLEYHNRSLVIYTLVKSEINQRKSELSNDQLLRLAKLDTELIALNDDILALMKEAESNGLDLNLIYTATTLLKFYSIL